MAIELIKSPIGHKLSPVIIEATIIDDGTGDALVYTETAHTLSDGEYVYIQSNFDSYNGYKYVDSIAYDSFKIKNSENSDPVLYVQDADIEYQVSVLDHGFQCVHLPIVYELHSDIYPNNIAEESYQPNTVAAFSGNSLGNTEIDLNYPLSDPVEFSKIELVGDGPLAGVYTILQVFQPFAVIINLSYDPSYDFSGYVVVKYYDNYAINVNVYAGYPTGHRWQSIKPFELAATLKFVPDNNGIVKFSISELLRAYIENRNNLTLDTLPNNTDFTTAFYISYYETYDQSDGEDITTFEGDVIEDDFTGYAVNAKLAFKSESVGHLSDYLDAGTNYAKWLTVFENPIIVVGYFFDISFLNQYNGFDILIKKGGVDYLNIPNPGAGVIRVPVEAEAGEEDICLIAYISGESDIDLSQFQNNPGSGTDWTTGDQPSVSGSNSTDILYLDYEFVPGVSYTLNSLFTQSGSVTFTFNINVYDNSFVLQHSGTNNNPSGQESVSVSFIAGENDKKIGFRRTISIGDATVTINSLTITIDEQQITEEICITVLEDCDDTFIEGARLLEDGNFRLLE